MLRWNNATFLSKIFAYSADYPEKFVSLNFSDSCFPSNFSDTVTGLFSAVSEVWEIAHVQGV